MAPVTLSAAPSVPETPVGGGQANDLFNDSDKTSTKKVDPLNYDAHPLTFHLD